MKKYFLILFAVVLTHTFNGQTHHKKKHHEKSTEKATIKVDTIKTVPTVSVSNEPTLQEMQNERYMGYLKLAGVIILVAILLIIISSIAAKKKRERELEEKIEKERQDKFKIKSDIEEALKKNEIYEEQYQELNSTYSSSNSKQLFSAFENSKNRKRQIDFLIAKYPEDIVSKILKQEYWIGMTEEQLIESKGQPDKIELEQLKTKTKKIYIYGNKSSGDVFNFVDGALERFKDR